MTEIHTTQTDENLLDYAMAIAHERELDVLGHKHDSDGTVRRFNAAVERFKACANGADIRVELNRLGMMARTAMSQGAGDMRNIMKELADRLLALASGASVASAPEVDERAAFESYCKERFGGVGEPWDYAAARYPYGPTQARWEAWRDGRARVARVNAPTANERISDEILWSWSQQVMGGKEANHVGRDRVLQYAKMLLASAPVGCQPVDMVLYCPACGVQHIDTTTEAWPNPPHRSHLCSDCGYVWRPADIHTNGVSTVKTKGLKDNPPLADQRDMSLVLALHFADFPRTNHSVEAPADTNGELYRALAVIARECRAILASSQVAGWPATTCSYVPSHDQPHQTGVGEWCAPGPAAEQRQTWLLRFADTDRPDCVYYDEMEARRAFAQAEGRGWNCYLFEYARRAPVAIVPVAGKVQTHRFKPPFDNCSFRLCDLPGQCRGEGKCHHPGESGATVKKPEKPIATLHDDGHYTWNGAKPEGYDHAGWRMEVYAPSQAPNFDAPTEAEAEEMGRKGAPHSETERKLYEAYCRGHCWAVGPWLADEGYYYEMPDRIRFAMWRDRAALSAP